jgi:DNA-binding NtrC family response regulator
VPATLVALFGPKRGVRWELGGATVLGRASTADLQLVDGKVSREHCRLTVEGDAVHLEDLGSQNGTFVNGEAIRAPRRLAAGDEIAVGDSLLLYDPELAVLSARFGDATVVVTDRAPAPARVAPAEDAAATGGVGALLGEVTRLAARLGRAKTVAEAVDAVLEAALDDLGAARGWLFAGDGAAAGLRALGGRSEALPAGAARQGAPVVPRALLAAAASERRAALFSGLVEDRAPTGTRSVVTTAARAVLVAPLVAADETIGFLYLERRTAGSWTRLEAARAEAVAAVTALHGLGGALAAASDAPTTDGPIGGSPLFARVLKLAAAAARTTSTVLVTGESGTGKEEIARAIHRLSGRGPFVALNCGAIPEALAEAELFGHERGAFTGAVAAREGRIEAADGGTLFLDEVGELPPPLQVKLLRVLQERIYCRLGSTTPRSVDLRVIAATHRDLEAEIAAGRFREDLYYRLNVIRIDIPPLRARAEDVAPLAAVLLARLARALGRPDPGLSSAALAALGRAPWPGNARQLANVLERALVLRDPAARGPLGADEIADALGEPGRPAAVPLPAAAAPLAAPGTEAAEKLPAQVASLERAAIFDALRAARGVKARAAKQLGISRPTLDKKMADLGIDLWGKERP